MFIQKKMKYNKKFIQFVKFIFVGVLNTAVDIGVLNILVFSFDSLEKNCSYMCYKAISFFVAVSFSYLCNKYIVFNDKVIGREKNNVREEGGRFFVVSVIGFLLNILTSSALYDFLTRACGSQISLYVLISASALLGSVVSLFWNYYGYTLWVFRVKVIT